MQYYKIAGLTVAMDSYGRTVRQAVPYETDPVKTPDIVIRSDAESFHKLHPNMCLEDCEYMMTGASFYRELLRFDGMLLHASAVAADGKAYLFSAPSGTGKSTHTGLWQQVYGKDRVQMLNDDKPAIRLLDGTFYAYGTPWSGKYDISMNAGFPLGGICVVRRGEENTIRRLEPGDSIFQIMDQTFRSQSPELIEKLLILMDKLLTTVPIWELHCNMDPEAAKVSFEAMTKA